jgi:hypothetical protein
MTALSGAPPNPGTKAATDAGCTCPVIDNNHGQFPVYRDEDGTGQWWITGGCPLHDRKEAQQ